MLPLETRCTTGRTSAKVRAMKSRQNFLQQTSLIHPIDPKLTFFCVSYYLGAFGTILLPHKTQCKTGRTSAKVRATKSHRNFSQRTHPIHPIGPKLTFWFVSYYLGAFGTIWLPYKTQCKTCRTCAKVRLTKSGRNFPQRTHPTTPLHSKLMFWCVSYYLGAFGIVWLPYKNLVQNGLKWCKSSCYEVVSEFFTTNH